MNVLDLFSGIGGFSLGLERAGMRTIAFCEIDPYCRRVLAKHWPGVPIHEDIRELTSSDISEPVDVICGGFPCQPWSLAGKRCGDKDDRDLWPQMRRIVADIKPRWVIGENVPGLDDKRFMGLDRTISDLEKLSYQAVPFEIPACAVDAPHKRSRLWIVAHADEQGPQGWHSRILQERTSERTIGPGGAFLPQPGCRGSEPTRGEKRRSTSPPRWRAEPNVGRVANGIPNRVDRLRALGNAVVPQIPELIGRAIIQADRKVA